MIVRVVAIIAVVNSSVVIVIVGYLFLCYCFVGNRVVIDSPIVIDVEFARVVAVFVRVDCCCS